MSSPWTHSPRSAWVTYLQYDAFMQLSQLEKAVLTSLIWPGMVFLLSNAGRRLATINSTNPCPRLLSMATLTAGILPALFKMDRMDLF